MVPYSFMIKYSKITAIANLQPTFTSLQNMFFNQGVFTSQQFSFRDVTLYLESVTGDVKIGQSTDKLNVKPNYFKKQFSLSSFLLT